MKRTELTRTVGLLEFETVGKVEKIVYGAAVDPLRKWIDDGGLEPQSGDRGRDAEGPARKPAPRSSIL